MVWNKQNTHTFLVWVNDSTAIWISVCWYLRKIGINLPQDETIALLGSYPNDTLYYYRNTCSNTFIATKFFIARLWKQPRCHQLITRQEMWYICAIEYYSTIKNKKRNVQINGWSEENYPSGVTKTQKDKCGIFSLMWILAVSSSMRKLESRC